MLVLLLRWWRLTGRSAGGMVAYRKALDDSLENDYQGWVVVH